MSEKTNRPPLNTHEAAAYLQLSTSTVTKARHFGTGPAYLKLGKAVRYQQADLDEWMLARRFQSTSAYPALPSGPDSPRPAQTVADQGRVTIGSRRQRKPRRSTSEVA